MENHIINIDSSLSEEYKKINILSSHFTYKFDLPLKNIIELNLTSVELPNTSYLISKKKNNYFFYIFYNDNNILIEIQEGNYTSQDLMVILEKKLKEIDEKFEIEIIPYMMLFKIYHSQEKVFTLNFQCDTSYRSLGSILGYTEDIYTDNHIYIAEKVINIIDNNYCFLSINDYGHVYHNRKKYISKIIMSSQKYEIVFDGRMKYVTKTIIFPQPIDLEILNIGLDDPQGNPLNLNGIPFSFTLEIKVIKNHLLKRYKELTFYNPELMDLILNDVMLTYFSNENRDLKIGETYDNILSTNIINHVGNVDNEVDNTIKMINNIDVERLSLLEIEEIDRKNNSEKKKRKLERLVKKFKEKYPSEYNKLKDDKKTLVKTVLKIVYKKKQKKIIGEKIIYD